MRISIFAATLAVLFVADISAEEVDVYLLSGQSNMEGSGLIADLQTDSQTAALQEMPGANFWNGETFEPLVVGKTKTSRQPTRFGPEIGFASAIASFDRPAYLVKYAASGMPLHRGFNAGNWLGNEPGPGRRTFYPGEVAGDPNQGTLYRSMLSRFQAAIAKLRSDGHTPIVRGFLWMQGEADAKQEVSATEYAASLKQLRDRLASDIKMDKPLAMVFGQVLPYEPAMERFTHRAEIRDEMAAADERSGDARSIPHVRMVSTDGLALNKDTVHYGSSGLLSLGRAFAVELKNMHGDAPPFPGKRTQWNGFDRFDFEVDGKPVLVVVPQKTASGKPWVWHGEFFGHKPAPDIELLKRGFHVVYMSVPNMLGSPTAVAHWNKFYHELTSQYGFAKKAALVGLSRGGLYCYNWAIANPDNVACIYGDAPVCDFKSWPGGFGAGQGSPRDWQLVLSQHGFKNYEEAKAYTGNPLDCLQPLADAGVPLLHVYGDADKVVPWDENTGLIAARYKQLGGQITLIAKAGVGHHPHGLEDSTPIVEFISRHSFSAMLSEKISN